jgi:hypothetical protein
MSKPKVLSAKIAQQIFGLGGDAPGLFEAALGFHTGTQSIKSVHIMNDLAQCVLGGAPGHGGDLLCRIVRAEDEDDGANTDDAIRADRRFGQAYARAFPAQLGPRKTSQIRGAAAALLNVDGGMYKPGDNMASSVATHRDLLGFEGFRRFRVGAYLSAILEEDGRRRVRELYLDTGDPVSRALLPLFSEEPLVDKQHASRPIDLSPFDRSLGRALLTMLQQPLSKPILLRYLALGSALGLVLKVLGVGRPNGRPTLLALPGDQEDVGPGPLREQAVLSFKLGVSELDRLLAEMLPRHPLA